MLLSSFPCLHPSVGALLLASVLVWVSGWVSALSVSLASSLVRVWVPVLVLPSSSSSSLAVSSVWVLLR